MAGGRRSVPDAAPRLFGASFGRPGRALSRTAVESRRVPHADPRPETAGVHWQIAKGGGFHYHEAEARGSALPLTVFLGGPPALILAAVAPLPEGLSRASRRLAPPREEAPHDDGAVSPAPPRRRRGVRAHRIGAAEGPEAGGPVRRPLRLLLAEARLSRLRGRPDLPAAERDLSGDGRRQAPAGGLLHRRLAAGAAVPAVSARDAVRRRPLELRGHGFPLARGGGREGPVRPRGDDLGLPHPRRGTARPHEVPPRHRREARPA